MMGCAMHGDEHVALFKIRISVRRRIEAKALFVGDRARGHALPRIAVAVDKAHAELPQRTEEGHLLGDDLTGGEKRA
jgi:hypothetical protein